jgi:hypothetical protein
MCDIIVDVFLAFTALGGKRWISIPYAPCAMVRKWIISGRFQLFHCVVQEKVDQDCVDVRVRMRLHDFSPDKLDTPDAEGFSLTELVSSCSKG